MCRYSASLLLVLVCCLHVREGRCGGPVDAPDWRAGVAVAVITPEQPMMLAGFASRREPAEGTASELHAKAVAVEDAEGTRLVIVAVDLIGIPRPLRERVETRVWEQFDLPREGLLLNASHTYCGPELQMTDTDLEEISEERREQTTEYCRRLEETLVELIGDALDGLQPARLEYSHARAGFAMNRRLKNPDPDGDPYLNHPNPDGPVDHHVPVLQVLGEDGSRRAILFGYACHNTTLFINEYAGDYAGYAQGFLEREHPGVTAVFVTGCGGDQNGFPRGTVELSRRHGRTLATAVEAALQNRQRVVRGPLRLGYDHVTLDYQEAPTREQLEATAEGRADAPFRSFELTAAHAQRLLRQLDREGRLAESYDCPVQTVQFGDDLILVALSGEVVVDYSLRLKRELAGEAAVWVSGYNNDVFAYVPSRRVLEEGGYEPRRSMNYYTTTLHPGPFAVSIEDRIVARVLALLGKAAAAPGDSSAAHQSRSN